MRRAWAWFGFQGEEGPGWRRRLGGMRLACRKHVVCVREAVPPPALNTMPLLCRPLCRTCSELEAARPAPYFQGLEALAKGERPEGVGSWSEAAEAAFKLLPLGEEAHGMAAREGWQRYCQLRAQAQLLAEENAEDARSDSGEARARGGGTVWQPSAAAAWAHHAAASDAASVPLFCQSPSSLLTLTPSSSHPPELCRLSRSTITPWIAWTVFSRALNSRSR